MCEICQGQTVVEYLDVVRETIDCCGWALQYVDSAMDADGVHPAFCYTVGLTEFGRPEIVISGRGPQESSSVLNSLGTAAWSKQIELEAGTRYNAAGFDVMIIDVPGGDGLLLTAAEIYGHRGFKVVQAVWMDLDGLLPWEGIPSSIVQPVFGRPPD